MRTNSQLFWIIFVDSDGINVSVDEGGATLTGDVANSSKRQSAVENAYEGGAESVVSRLDVETDDKHSHNLRSYCRGYLYWYRRNCERRCS